MSAILSPCQRYRYRLSREVGILGDRVYAYFGVNPATADAIADDPTVRKWIRFTQKNGGKRFIVGNVFAYRASEIKTLASAYDPVGPENGYYLRKIVDEADILVPCWGSRAKLPRHLHYHLDAMMAMLVSSGKPVMTFGLTASGDPRHPLMLSYETEFIIHS